MPGADTPMKSGKSDGFFNILSFLDHPVCRKQFSTTNNEAKATDYATLMQEFQPSGVRQSR